MNLRSLRSPVLRRADFVVILAPTATILRPVTSAALAWLADAYASAPRGIGQSLVFAASATEEFHNAIDAASCADLTLEVL
jgi:hypothetical protein